MTPKPSPICGDCKKTESLLWRSVDQQQICQECFELRESKDAAEANAGESDKLNSEAHDDKKSKMLKDREDIKEEEMSTNEKSLRLRKSTRATRFKPKSSAASSNAAAVHGNGEKNAASSTTKQQTKGRNRRSLFKRTPFKTPMTQATTHSVNSVFHKGSYLQIGDIVSILDDDDHVYYAQIRGLLVDNYCEKSAFLTWLIPTQESPDPKEGFDPATYLIGPDEELSRKLSYLEFIMHAPSNYYYDRTTPFPLPDEMEYDTKPGGYIWTSLPEVERNKTVAEES